MLRCQNCRMIFETNVQLERHVDKFCDQLDKSVTVGRSKIQELERLKQRNRHLRQRQDEEEQNLLRKLRTTEHDIELSSMEPVNWKSRKPVEDPMVKIRDQIKILKAAQRETCSDVDYSPSRVSHCSRPAMSDCSMSIHLKDELSLPDPERWKATNKLLAPKAESSSMKKIKDQQKRLAEQNQEIQQRIQRMRGEAAEKKDDYGPQQTPKTPESRVSYGSSSTRRTPSNGRGSRIPRRSNGSHAESEQIQKMRSLLSSSHIRSHDEALERATVTNQSITNGRPPPPYQIPQSTDRSQDNGGSRKPPSAVMPPEQKVWRFEDPRWNQAPPLPTTWEEPTPESPTPGSLPKSPGVRRGQEWAAPPQASFSPQRYPPPASLQEQYNWQRHQPQAPPSLPTQWNHYAAPAAPPPSLPSQWDYYSAPAAPPPSLPNTHPLSTNWVSAEQVTSLLNVVKEQEEKNGRVLVDLKRQIEQLTRQQNLKTQPSVPHRQLSNMRSEAEHMLDDINLMREEYLDNGGSDPAVLAELRQLASEALSISSIGPTRKTHPYKGRGQAPRNAYHNPRKRLEMEREKQKLERELARLQQDRLTGLERENSGVHYT